MVKRTLIYCRSLDSEKLEHLRSIFVSTYGILFLGTPHNGADIAKWGTLLQSICSAVLPKKIMETSSQLVTSLRTNNETLQNINVLFTDMLPRFHIYFFHETRSTDVKGTRQVIVDESSASPLVEGSERAGIEADHISMCKFEDENAPGYEVVADALQRYSDESLGLIKKRWDEEIVARDLRRKAQIDVILHDGKTGMSTTTNLPSEIVVLTDTDEETGPRLERVDNPDPPRSDDGRTHLLAAPGSSITLQHYEVEEPSSEPSSYSSSRRA